MNIMSKDALFSIKWREPNEEEKVKLAPVRRKNRISAIILIVIFLVVLTICVSLIVGPIRNSSSALPLIIVTALFGIGFLLFIIRRIHILSKYEVADVILEEIVRSESSVASVLETATVSQGDVTVTGVHIYCSENPPVGSKVLLFIENKDSWSSGII